MYVFSWLQHSRIMVTTSISRPGSTWIFISLWPASSKSSALMMVR
jgi:hypothetical protein